MDDVTSPVQWMSDDHPNAGVCFRQGADVGASVFLLNPQDLVETVLMVLL